ncbi:fatty acid-binding protein, liver-type-like [Ptychodera flava]|uniref:fatty acid-binding protein, liver-type-like n=1 Tax=Ptychodera flava TaxID=63121 RepID=UPI003969D689
MSTIPGEFIGKWELDRHENSEALFAALGVPESLREKMASVKNTVDIREDDAVITIREGGLPGQPDRVQIFRLGEEREIESMFGKRLSVVTLEDGKLVRRNANPDEDIVRGYRQVIDGELVMTATVVKTGVTANAFYKKID